MIRAAFISIQNFKIFGQNVKIDLTSPTVLIGPNNSGKTSVLQAFALWSLGIKTWNLHKGQSKARIRYGVPINRLNLSQLPVQNARFLWNNCEVRKGSTEPIIVTITIGLEIDGGLYECSIEFTQSNSELIYCKPKGCLVEDGHILEIATNIQVNLLYSMSGIAIEEVRLPMERVNYLMGQGMTSEVLRNLCFNLYEESPNDWNTIIKWMNKLFGMQIQPPRYIEAKGSLELTYKHHGAKRALDIASAGRGALQILLLLSYMYSHKSSIILVDEPDAHLEIIKQRTVYALLNEIANVNGIQLIIATHSEVVLNEAVDNNIAMLLDGDIKSISDKDKDIKPILKEFGVEHFYKASITKNILYIEGSTDISMLKEFAKLLGREKVVDILDGELNSYYIQNPCYDNNIENIVDRKEGFYNSKYIRHFTAIKKMIPDFVGLGIFDSDGNNNNDGKYPEGLSIIKWKKYELENYFISLNVLDQYFEDIVDGVDNIYYQFYLKAKENTIIQWLFNGKIDDYKTYQASSPDAQQLLWVTSTRNKKMSEFMGILMDEFVELSGLSYPMRKGEYYKLIPYMDPENVDAEITSALDAIEKVLS